MRYLGEDEATEPMGGGYPGEVRVGPDGNLYQWVEGVDGLGNPVGFWRALRRLRRGLRRIVRRAMPVFQQVAPFVPALAPAAAALRTASPFLRRAGIAGYEGFGALYQAPDGSVYEVPGLAEDEELPGVGGDEELPLAGDEMTELMGIGYLGEVRVGPNGNLYQWVEGVDGLGNPVGFWRALRRLRRGLRRIVRQAMPVFQQVAPFVPALAPAAAALRTASPFLRRAGIAGYDGFGALYQAPDGSVYEVPGLAEDEELPGIRGEEELPLLAEDEELRSIGEEDELPGVGGEDELPLSAEDEELRGFGGDEELQDLAAYVRDERVSGLEAYVREEPARTRWSTAPPHAPEMWRPLW